MFESNYNFNVSNIPINQTCHAKNYFAKKKLKLSLYKNTSYWVIIHKVICMFNDIWYKMSSYIVLILIS